MCQKCGKIGHTREQCWSKGGKDGKGKSKDSKGKGKGSKSGEKPTCSKCGKVGHLAETCWSKNVNALESTKTNSET
jgi:hypothetical protein